MIALLVSGTVSVVILWVYSGFVRALFCTGTTWMVYHIWVARQIWVRVSERHRDQASGAVKEILTPYARASRSLAGNPHWGGLGRHW